MTDTVDRRSSDEVMLNVHTDAAVDIFTRDKLRPVPKHGSIILGVHGNQKAR